MSSHLSFSVVLWSSEFRFHPQAKPETQEFSRAGEVFHTMLQVLKKRAEQEHERVFRAADLLSEENLQLLAQLSECPAAPSPDLCESSRHHKYRSVSGVCNNRINPLWGAAGSALVRWLPAEYEDEEGEPKGWNPERLHNGFLLPSPRRVSREIISSSCKRADEEYTQLLVDWGQYIDHDISFTPQSSSSTAAWTDVDCYNTCENVHPCFPIQIITMRDYVPKIIGLESLERYVGPYGGYDPTIDASAANVFATAAFRFGHATIYPVLSRFNESFQEHERFPHLRLHESFFSPWRIVKEGGIEPTVRGLIGSPAPAVSPNSLLVEDVTEMLVVLDTRRHMDLAALNLQRGRDHGLAGYNEWREFCGLKRIETLDELTEAVRDFRVAQKILNVYKHLDNIDVWLGGLVEKFLPGSRTGPLFACLIGKQMKVLRDGDRFWWEAEGVFTQQQQQELLKVSLSRVICDNSDIQEVPPDSFRYGKYPTDYVSCRDVASMNLEVWREEESKDLQQCGSPRPIKNGDFIFSSKSGKLTALYSCYHGFTLEGAAEIFCEGDRWSDGPPRCACE
uniref:Thyroid peroxidase n=1 Tax=Nothobranchius furzeri TaxID=105023 RepID=A0A8C6PTE9_NOTFU